MCCVQIRLWVWVRPWGCVQIRLGGMGAPLRCVQIRLWVWVRPCAVFKYDYGYGCAHGAVFKCEYGYGSALALASNTTMGMGAPLRWRQIRLWVWVRPCAGVRCEYCHYFRRKIFRKEIFNSVVGAFFLFLKLPMTRRAQICRVGVLYNTCVGCHCSSEARGGWLESWYRPYFLHFYRYLLKLSLFLTTKFQGFLVIWLFSQKIPLFRLT